MSRPRSIRVHTLRLWPSRRLAALFLVLFASLSLTWSGSSVGAQEGTQPPAKPTGLTVTTTAGSLSVSLDWDDVDGTTAYKVRWREAGPEHELNMGIGVQVSQATITVADYGDWVVRVQVCNGNGCGPGASTRFQVEQEPPARPTGLAVATQAGSLDLSVSWTAAQGADSYKLQWRRPSGDFGDNQVTTTETEASFTVAGYGRWVVRVEGCNDAGCGPGASETLEVEQGVPGQSTGLTVSTQQGSLDVTLDWDDVNGADSYLVRWREYGSEHELNDGTTVEASRATITVADYGDWVLRLEACNDAGCGQHLTRRFQVEDSAVAPDSEVLAVSITADKTSPTTGERVTLTAAISNPPSESEPSYAWEMDAGGWFVAGRTETFSYMTETAETWGFRVTVAYGSAESATSEPITVAWTAPETAQSVPGQPTTLGVATQQGSLDVSLDWDDVDGATSYLVRWRQDGDGHELNEGVSVDTSNADITVADYGDWVVRLEACNDAGCGTHLAQEFTVEAANRAPVVDEQADSYDSFTGSQSAPRGILVFKSFEGIFSDPDGDELTYTVSMPDDRAALVETLAFHNTQPRLGFEYDGDDDWNAADPALPDPITTEITLTATDPDGLSASLTGRFHADWESHPVLGGVDAHGTTMIVVFDHDLQATPAPLPGQFTVKVFNADGASAGTIAVDSVEIRDRRVFLELASAPEEDEQSLTLDYAHDDDRPLKRAAAGGDSAPGFTGQFVWRVIVDSDPPDGQSNLIVASDNPDSSKLVGNTGPGTAALSSLNTNDVAVAFTTGPHPPGYTLTAVRIKLVERSTTGLTYPALSVRVCRESSGSPSTSCLGRRPLANPAILDSGVKTFPVLAGPGTGIHLEPGTTYFVVIDVAAAGTREIAVSRISHTVDAGAAAGWSILNEYAFRPLDSTGAWKTLGMFPYQFEIVGFQNYFDYDTDYDGLIEISNADQLNAIRWDENGDGTPESSQSSYNAAFPHAVPGMGCPDNGCTGYELARDIDLASWSNWTPIPNLRATFEGNGHIIENLTIDRGTQQNTAFFANIRADGEVRNLGLVGVDVRGGNQTAALAVVNRGRIVGSYSTGRVSAVNNANLATVGSVGGLVGFNGGKIHASYSSATVYASASGTNGSVSSVGGLTGTNSGANSEIKASYASGSVTAENADAQSGIGGLTGSSGNGAQIRASYSVGVVTADAHASAVGGLVGAGVPAPVADSYWDLGASGQNTSGGGTGKLTAELTAPTGYTGIYANWNVDLDGDGVGDNPWRFGNASDYPALSLKLPDIPARPGSVGRQGARLNHRPHAFLTCRENIGIGRVPGDSWRADCNSRALSGHHAFYYTFTLAQEARVRLHVSAHAPARPRLILREGYSEVGEGLHQGQPWQYSYTTSRIDERLPAGTYTVEVANARPGLWFTLSTGTVTPPPLASSIWEADLIVQHISGSFFGCRSATGKECGTHLAPNSFTHQGTTYEVNRLIAGPSQLNIQLSQTIPLDWTLYVDGNPFRVADRTSGSNTSARWTTGVPTWTAGSTVKLRIVDPNSGDPTCVQAIDRGQTDAGRWNADCASVSHGGRAAYYTYTPDRNRGITFTLTSPDADERMYLWEGDRLVAERWGQNQAQLSHYLTAGTTYTIEVTGRGAGPNGRYLLAMWGDFNPEGTDAPARVQGVNCTQNLGTIDDGSQTYPNGWTFGAHGGDEYESFDWPCHSVDRPGTYARYFTFTLSQARDVRAELYLSPGASMFLRQGNKGSGAHALASHAPGQPVTARMDREGLPAGTYTIEVVAASPGTTGNFDLVIKELPPKFTPPAKCLTDLKDITYVGTHSDKHTGEWGAGGCGSYSRTSAHARFFKFTLTHTVQLAFHLGGGANSRIYLFEGASFREPLESDLSWIERNLAPGTYTIEVTTLRGTGRSDDEYTLSYRRTGPAPPEPTGSGPSSGQVWTASLTVQQVGKYNSLGCFGAGSCRTGLSSSAFFVGTTRHEVWQVTLDEHGRLSFQVSKALPAGSWTLHVGDDVQISFTASGSNGGWSWNREGGYSLGWSAGDTVALRLVKNS